MRTNYFVGVEGTFGLIRRALEADARTSVFETFFGVDARARVDSPFEDILNYLFDSTAGLEEANIGITRTGAAGGLLDILLNKTPAPRRIFYFKSTDFAESVSLHSSFLKISADKIRVERLTGMSESVILSNSEAVNEATAEALAALDVHADSKQATAWAPFGAGVLFGETADPNSKILFRLANIN